MQTFQNQATLSYNGITLVSNTTRGTITDVLSVLKTAVTPTYGDGTTQTYVVTIVNTGSTAYTGLTLTDDLGSYSFTPTGGTPINLQPLNFVANPVLYYVNGVQQSPLSVTPAENLVIPNISVPANGNATIIYTTETNEYAPLSTSATITNTVTLTGNGIATPITNDEEITASATPDLSIVKSLSPTTVSGTGTVTYTFEILNSGNTEAGTTANAIISDTFTPVLSGISVALNGTAIQPPAYSYNTTSGAFSTASGTITVPAATYTQDAVSGVYSVTPGSTILTVTGTVNGN